jgi:cell division septum initiation protein DivIVA
MDQKRTIDLNNPDLRIVAMGYDKQQTKELLQELAREIARLNAELDEAYAQIDDLEKTKHTQPANTIAPQPAQPVALVANPTPVAPAPAAAAPTAGHEQIAEVLILAHRLAEEVKQKAAADAEQVTRTAAVTIQAMKEQTEREALATRGAAQVEADQIRAKAKAEADAILNQATAATREAIAQHEQKLNDLRWEMERLRQEREKQLHLMRGMIEAQIADLSKHLGTKLVVVETEPSQVNPSSLG